jgi:hypothetical protein
VTEMQRRFTVRNTEKWEPDCFYWCVGLGWYHLDNATIYNSYGEAKFMADRVNGFVAPTWTEG